MRDFRDLVVWQKAHALTLEVYMATRNFHADERYGLTSQLRRSASSTAANIAEGCGRDTAPDLARFISIAAGSASETEYHLILARDLGYLTEPMFDSLNGLVAEVKKMLRSFHRHLTAKS